MKRGRLVEAQRLFERYLAMDPPTGWAIKARKAERQSGKRKLFPIRLVDFATLRDWECFDADSGKDLAVELREYFIPDFSRWKEHNTFEASFERLLADLRAEEPV